MLGGFGYMFPIYPHRLLSQDVIVTCSRSGQVPLYLWYTLSLRGFGGVRRQVQHTLHLAQRLKVRRAFVGQAAAALAAMGRCALQTCHWIEPSILLPTHAEGHLNVD